MNPVLLAYLREYRDAIVFLSCLVLGIVLICAGLFTIGCTIGLIGTGVAVLIAGHWVVYLAWARHAGGEA